MSDYIENIRYIMAAHFPSTYYDQFFLTYYPVQFDEEKMFDYYEDMMDTELHNHVINKPKQKHVLGTVNFKFLLKRICPYSEEYIERFGDLQEIEEESSQESIVMPDEEEDREDHSDIYKQTEFSFSLDSSEESIIPWSTPSESIYSSSMESDMESDEGQTSSIHCLNNTVYNLVLSVSSYSICTSSQESDIESDDEAEITNNSVFNYIHELFNSSQKSAIVDEDYERSFPFAKLSTSIFMDKYRGNYAALKYPCEFTTTVSTTSVDEHIYTEAKDEVEMEPATSIMIMAYSNKYNDYDKSCSDLTKYTGSPLKTAADTSKVVSHLEEYTSNESNLEQEIAEEEMPKRKSLRDRFRQVIRTLKKPIDYISDKIRTKIIARL